MFDEVARERMIDTFSHVRRTIRPDSSAAVEFEDPATLDPVDLLHMEPSHLAALALVVGYILPHLTLDRWGAEQGPFCIF